MEGIRVSSIIRATSQSSESVPAGSVYISALLRPDCYLLSSIILIHLIHLIHLHSRPLDRTETSDADLRQHIPINPYPDTMTGLDTSGRQGSCNLIHYHHDGSSWYVLKYCPSHRVVMDARSSTLGNGSYCRPLGPTVTQPAPDWALLAHNSKTGLFHPGAPGYERHDQWLLHVVVRDGTLHPRPRDNGGFFDASQHGGNGR